MRQHDLIESTLTFLTGAGVGTALMYLLDPDAGHKRRGQLRQNALGAVESTRDSVTSAVESVESAYHTVGQKAHDWTDRVRDSLSHLKDRAAALPHAARHDAGALADSARSALSRGAAHLPRVTWKQDDEESDGFSAATFAATALTTAVAGAALMYLFDPKQGARRRSALASQARALTGAVPSRHAPDRGTQLSTAAASGPTPSASTPVDRPADARPFRPMP